MKLSEVIYLLWRFMSRSNAGNGRGAVPSSFRVELIAVLSSAEDSLLRKEKIKTLLAIMVAHSKKRGRPSKDCKECSDAA